jgi:hypothetical protein
LDSLTWIEAVASIRVWEFCAVLAAVVVAFLLPRGFDRPFERLESAFKKFAHRPALSLLAVGASAVLLRLALYPLLGTPHPAIHDEYAYLLAADTFLHGRVANPPHPLWKFFESFHILQQPTYASMYPPAQGLFLAAGRLLTGHAYAGVLLSSGLLCAALLWMLRGWLPPQWALLGATFAILRIGLFSYWANSYWGGAPAAIGGALVAGSIPRIMRWPRARDAILLGLGLILLASSRPFEGLFFSIPFGLALLVWMLRRDSSRAKLVHAVLPLCGVLATGGAALAYYNWRITGDAFEPPQLRNMRQYGSYGVMLWDKRRPEPHYNNETMRIFYSQLEERYAAVPHSLTQVLPVLGRKALVVFHFFLGPLLAAPLILAFSVLLKKRLRLLLLAILSIAIGVACQRWVPLPHYFAPATCAIYAVMVFAMHDLWNWRWRERPCGHFLVRGFLAVALIMVAVRILAEPLGIELQWFPRDWSTTIPGDFERAALASRLNRAPERFLVIVRYGPEHEPDREWVYNDADIDGAKIVWARDRGPENDALIRYFHDRRVIVAEPDVGR